MSHATQEHPLRILSSKIRSASDAPRIAGHAPHREPLALRSNAQIPLPCLHSALACDTPHAASTRATSVIIVTLPVPLPSCCIASHFLATDLQIRVL